MQLNSDAVKEAVKGNPDLGDLVRALGTRQRSTKLLNIRRFSAISGIPRDKLIRGLEGLQKLGAGKLVQGPTGHPLAFQWALPLLDLVKVSTGRIKRSQQPARGLKMEFMRILLPGGGVLLVAKDTPNSELGKLMRGIYELTSAAK